MHTESSSAPVPAALPQDVSVSVIVCTYNRCGTLAATLESAAALRIPAGVSWELLVVDNNSTDGTREVVLGFAGRLPVRYLYEPRQGKTLALNRALAEAQGDLLLFTDDDVQLVAAGPRVHGQDPVPAEEVVARRAVLGPQADAAAAISSSVR